MVRSLVVVEMDNGQPTGGTLGLLTKASELGAASAIVFGGDAGVAPLLGVHGCEVLHWSDQPELATGLAQARVDAVAGLVAAEGYDTILLENSPGNADLAAGLAVRLGAGVNWGLLDLASEDGRLTGVAGALEDALLVDVGWTTEVRIGVLRTQALEPVEAARPTTPEPRPYQATFAAHSLRARVVGRSEVDSADTGQLATASVVVAGGRGIARREDFALLEELADALGGTLGVSMPIVDKGWYPHARQVGQTGTTVRPKLYLAVGISGAIQHRVGMAKAGTIVAINSDPSAPIFGIADLGVVGDWNVVIPNLIAGVRARVQ